MPVGVRVPPPAHRSTTIARRGPVGSFYEGWGWGLSAGVGLLRVVFVEEVLVGAFLLLERVEVFDVGGVPVPVPGWGWEEPAAVWWCVGVDAVSFAVDGDVVVVPAEGGEVGGGVFSAVTSGGDVVGLEAVAAAAGVDDAFSVSGEYGSAEPFGDVTSGRFDVHYLAVCDGDGFGASFAFGCFYCLGSCSGSAEDFHAAGVAGGFGECFVSDEHDDGFASGGVSGCEVVV